VKERLQKVIANLGYASRRKAEALIEKGAVRVNGKKITKLGTKVDPSADQISVNGKSLQAGEKKYFLLNKPSECVTSVNDEHSRRTVLDILPKYPGLHPVGRLDINSEGLLIVTNDGDLTYKVSHPKFEHEKEYKVKVKGQPTLDSIEKLEKGILMDGKKTKPCKIRMINKVKTLSWLKITLKEGRYHQVRKMFNSIGHPVVYLQRTRIDFLELDDLDAGHFRELTEEEVDKLKNA